MFYLMQLPACFSLIKFICWYKYAGGSHLCLWAEEILCSDLPRVTATAEVCVPLHLSELTRVGVRDTGAPMHMGW